MGWFSGKDNNKDDLFHANEKALREFTRETKEKDEKDEKKGWW